MNPEIEELKKRIKALEDIIVYRGGIITINGTVKVKGRLNADRVYTARTGNHTELVS